MLLSLLSPLPSLLWADAVVFTHAVIVVVGGGGGGPKVADDDDNGAGGGSFAESCATERGRHRRVCGDSERRDADTTPAAAPPTLRCGFARAARNIGARLSSALKGGSATVTAETLVSAVVLLPAPVPRPIPAHPQPTPESSEESPLRSTIGSPDGERATVASGRMGDGCGDEPSWAPLSSAGEVRSELR